MTERILCGSAKPPKFQMANKDQTSLQTVEKLQKLKRKRATQRAYATRFMNAINCTFDDSTDIEEVEHYRDHLQEALQNLILLDESIHDLLDDQEYATDAEKCEELLDGVKRAVRKADRVKDERGETATHTAGKSQTVHSQPTVIQEIKLPHI